jgi:hypothetical protein
MHTQADICKASLLEQLEARIPYRSNLNYVEEEYDGAAPLGANNQIHLPEEDLLLMWKLFDCVATYTKQNSQFVPDERLDSVMHDVPSESSETSTLINSQRSGHSSSNTPTGIQTMKSRLEDIAVRSYGDRPSNCGSVFDYSHIDFDFDIPHLAPSFRYSGPTAAVAEFQ